MGTSGSWGGSGSAAAKSLKGTLASDDSPAAGTGSGRPRIDPDDLRDAVRLLDGRTATKASGPGSSRAGSGGARRRPSNRGGSGGAKRSSPKTARTAGRAIAGAIAYTRGDRQTLERLGLDLDELSRLGDPFEVIRRIVEMACGASDSTIEDHEQRLMAADLAQELILDGGELNAALVVEAALASILTEVILSECGAMFATQSQAVTEQDVRDAAEAIASRASYSTSGLTEDDVARSIERGLNDLREVLGIDDD